MEKQKEQRKKVTNSNGKVNDVNNDEKIFDLRVMLIPTENFRTEDFLFLQY